MKKRIKKSKSKLVKKNKPVKKHSGKKSLKSQVQKKLTSRNKNQLNKERAAATVEALLPQNPAAQLRAPQPTRAPRRQIIKEGNVLRIVTPNAPSPAPQTEAVSTPENRSAVVEKTAVKTEDLVPEAPAREKQPWDNLAQNLPAQIRFFMRMARQECDRVIGSAFPFAKFLSTLPSEVCGMEFGLLVLSLTHDIHAVSELCGISLEQCNRIVEGATVNLEDKFTSACGVMSRRWRSQLAGPGQSLRTLIEPYLLKELDRDFQLVFTQIMVKAMGAGNPIVNGAVKLDVWSSNPRIIKTQAS